MTGAIARSGTGWYCRAGTGVFRSPRSAASSASALRIAMNEVSRGQNQRYQAGGGHTSQSQTNQRMISSRKPRPIRRPQPVRRGAEAAGSGGRKATQSRDHGGAPPHRDRIGGIGNRDAEIERVPRLTQRKPAI